MLRMVDKRPPADPVAVDWFARPGRMDALSGLVAPMGRSGWTVDLVLVDDAAMADLNHRYRQAPGVTDVLSFSYLEEAGNGPPDLAAGQNGACRDLWLDSPTGGNEDGPIEAVGEIVLAPEFIARRCREMGWPLDHEMPMLVVHGMMHILGWDHADEKETEAMQAVEQEILAAAGLPHPMRGRG